MPAQPNLTRRLVLIVHTRTGELMNEEVKSISSINDTGEFDVLQMHAQFITKINNHIKVTKMDGNNIVIPVGDAIMRVKGDHVEVFLGIKSA